MKITVIGAGNVGATCANVLAHKNFAKEIVLLDIKEGLAEGKALDIWQTSPVNMYDTRVTGVTGDYPATGGSDLIIITSGLPRKPGMSRDDLISTNAKIVKEVTEKSVKESPDAIILVVSNPLDVTELLEKDVIEAIVERTKKGGGELVKLMGTSAWYAPGAAVAQMVESILLDQNRIFPCCVKLNGEFGLKDVFLGVPVKLGRNGIEKIIEIDLNEDEKKLLYTSADAVQLVMKVMDDMKLF